MSRRPRDVHAMSPAEQRATFALATVYGFRMLGLFLVLPVFALYAEHLEGATPLLVGLAIGAYGLTQALLQIPFGMVSDRIGRKPVIIAGLVLFALGSALAALATDIWLVAIGRALQGSGAVAGVAMALLADLTRESQRTKAMALIGMTIGVSFAVALMAGPLLGELIGVPGIFWLIAGFAIVGIALVVFVVPDPEHSVVHRDTEVVRGELGDVLRNRNLLRLDFGIFALHAVMTSLFLALPLELRDLAGMASADHWKIYLPAMVLSLATMVPFVVLAEKRGHMKGVFLLAVALLALALGGLYAPGASVWGVLAWVYVFFVGFNILEATLPSLVSKFAPATAKGTAMGVYGTAQFAGAFLGGIGGGLAHQHLGPEGVFAFGIGVCMLWLAVATGMRTPRQLSNQLLSVGPVDGDGAAALTARLLAVPGVAEAVVVTEEGVAYLKVDRSVLDPRALDAFCPADA